MCNRRTNQSRLLVQAAHVHRPWSSPTSVTKPLKMPALSIRRLLACYPTQFPIGRWQGNFDRMNGLYDERLHAQHDTAKVTPSYPQYQQRHCAFVYPARSAGQYQKTHSIIMCQTLLRGKRSIRQVECKIETYTPADHRLALLSQDMGLANCPTCSKQPHQTEAGLQRHALYLTVIML